MNFSLNEYQKNYKSKISAIKEGDIRLNLKQNREHKFVKIVNKEDRMTNDVISHYEYTEVVSIRAKHIEKGSTIYVEYKNEVNPIKIAEMEIQNKSCPLIIIRYINNNTIEIWDVNELIIPYIKK